MANTTIYQDIAGRTGGDIYIGVCGPVRTGKSTFIKRFMDLLVLPNMEDGPEKERTRDELPQSAAGKMIMTTEPKFIPKDGAKIALDDGTEMKVRMVDCVGYMVEGALGHEEDGGDRMVKTPWFDYEIPFTKAAEIGTSKVIHDHSTIGIVVTTDGSIGEIERNAYTKPEEQTISEMKALNKPFIILLNSKHPYSDETVALAEQLEEAYSVRTLPVNCMQLRKDDIMKILEAILYEFPVTEIEFYLPKWTEMLENEHPVKSALIEAARKILTSTGYIKDVEKYKTAVDAPIEGPITKMHFEGQDLSNGMVRFRFDVDSKYYFEMLSQMTGMEITSDYHLFSMLKNYAKTKDQYSKVADALEAVKAKGYGVVTPERDTITLAEPEIMRSGNKFGVKIKATAPSIHLIQTDIQTEIAPIVGTEDQAKDLIGFIEQNSKTSPEGIWNTNIFGKTIEQIVDDGISTKLTKLSEETRDRMKGTLEKITNDCNRGVICIIL